MLKKIMYVLAFLLMIFSTQAICQAKEAKKIAVQSYTFRLYTFEELVPMLKSIGVDAIGCSGGMEISSKWPKVKFGPNMTAEQKAFVKDIADKNNIKFISYGVVGADNEAGVKKICEFAKEMNIPAIITEAPKDLLVYWDKYAKANDVIMAIHNHAKETKNGYWNPKLVAELIKPYKNIYACGDNGHWSRAGVKSLDGYEILKGRLAVIHFKDQKEFGNPKNQPVPFGTGQLNCKELLKALDAQGYNDYFVIEYERDWDNPLPAVEKCVEFLRNN